PVLGLPDRVELGADQLDPEPIERAVLRQRDREVQARLTAQGRQERLRTLALDDLRDELRCQWLDVRPVRQLGVRHDRGRVRVHPDDLEPLFPQRTATLRPGVVELARLTDDDRPGADDQDALEVGTLGHRASARRAPRRLFLHETIDDRRLRRRFLAAIEHVVEPAVADPRDLAAAPELLAQDAHAPVDPLADRVGFERGLALRGERGPLRLLAAPFGLAVGDEGFGHDAVSSPSEPSSPRTGGRVSWRREGRARPRGGTARRRPATRGAGGLRRYRR